MPDRAHLRELDRLLSSAWLEAKALENHWLGPEHFFLAILAPAGVTPAAVALGACGLDHDAFARDLTAAHATADPPQDTPAQSDLDSPSSNPAMYTVMGRAEGLAAGFGAPAVTAEHVLIACLWDPSTCVYMEEFSGVTREAVLGELGRLGVPLPRAALPPRPRRPGMRVFVPYDGLMTTVGELLTRLPPDSGFGFNHDGKSRAWVSAYPEIDLAQEVKAVLGELGLDPVPQPEEQ